MKKQIGIFLSLVVLTTSQATLASIDCVNYAENTLNYVQNNAIGLSMEILEVINNIDNQLLQEYLLNSQAYGSWSSNFGLTLHNPIGAKYNCSLADTTANSTLNCTFDMDNSSFMQSFGEFSWNTSNFFSLTVGWDNEGANFVDKDYMENSFDAFRKEFYQTSRQPFQMEVADKADTWDATGFRPGYNHFQPQTDCRNMNKYAYIWYHSPGLTEAASSSWFNEMRKINWECGQFTVRGVVFPNTSDLTIANLLSENYTSQYLQRRFTVGGQSYLSNLALYSVSFNDIRLVEGQGIDGLTNSFAAAIWAIQIVMEWAIIDGYRIKFYSPIASPSFQSPLGQAPNFNPSALYYGLLLAVIANSYNPYIIRPTVTSGTSSSIKTYYLDYGSYDGVLMLNKDVNTGASGVVSVKLEDQSGLNCIYLSADNLSSTAMKIANYSYMAGNAVPQGTFQYIKVMPGLNHLYSVPLNYSQAVFCKTVPYKNSYFNFPRYSWESWINAIILLLIFVILE